MKIKHFKYIMEVHFFFTWVIIKQHFDYKENNIFPAGEFVCYRQTVWIYK